MDKIELLVPAKNLESGKVAINYGADAVYIGADRFGARAAAGNSVDEITELVKFAHQYGAKVFVTLNTILYDEELKEAEKLISDIYDSGADALIIQDMGILKMNIPPIPFHASTQANNFKLDRIQFLDELGFERIILARELSLDEIKNIRAHTKTELEFFIHGALCVSLSGQCYFSQAVTGRSANRGKCAQMCRHPYNLLDAYGKRIVLNSHLLSLKDLNLGSQLKGLLDAGITSLKIEGRLKDVNYVKNVVSYYRQKLDELFISEPNYKKASSGKTKISFESDTERSFNRSKTDYFLVDRDQDMINPFTPKSMGKRMGTVKKVDHSFISVNSSIDFHNGDGLCFIHKNKLIGIRVEKVIGDKIYVNDISNLKNGIELYRNHDHEFNKILDSDQSIRKIAARINVAETNEQIHIEIKDEDQLVSQYIIPDLPEVARNADSAMRNLRTQLSKSGNSIFNIEDVQIGFDTPYFFPISVLNKIRRDLFEKHIEHRIKKFARKDRAIEENDVQYPKTKVDFSANISNKKAEEFYKEHGVLKQEKALEVGQVRRDQLLMTTRYCIKYELGYCTRFQNVKESPKEPLFLEDHNRKYLLDFDCKNCLMKIKLHN